MQLVPVQLLPVLPAELVPVLAAELVPVLVPVLQAQRDCRTSRPCCCSSVPRIVALVDDGANVRSGTRSRCTVVVERTMAVVVVAFLP